MYYPLMFEPIYKQKIWGGEKLAGLFGMELPFPGVGEVWSVSCRPGDMCTVKNGRLRGTVFSQLIGISPEGFLGKALCGRAGFPLLVKLIDANDDLSVQVHPDEKNEVWYVVHADEGTRINAGLLPGTTAEVFERAIAEGNVEKHLNYFPIRAGDVINLRAGTVHALCSGAVVAEIQQNSDTTYRVYDYGRVDSAGNARPLHIKKALETIDFGASGGLAKGRASDIPGGQSIFYCETEHYALYEYRVASTIRESSDPERFFIFLCIEGGCEFRANGYSAAVSAGDSVMIPAALGGYEIVGNARLLKSFVPGSAR